MHTNIKPAIALMAIAITPWLMAANTTPYPMPNGVRGPKQLCSQDNVLSASAMTGSPSFGIDQDGDYGERPKVTLFVSLTDADTSITRLDVTCTTSDDGNTTDYVPQIPKVDSGVATLSDGLIFRKSSPGTKNMAIGFDLENDPDFECTLTVGAGSATAVIDVVTVEVRMCAR